jgi:sulfur carrier protein ThiS
VRRHLPNSPERFDVEMSTDSTVADLLEQVGLDERQFWFVTLKDRRGENIGRVKRDHRLADGDQVSLFPYVGGG